MIALDEMYAHVDRIAAAADAGDMEAQGEWEALERHLAAVVFADVTRIRRVLDVVAELGGADELRAAVQGYLDEVERIERMEGRVL